MFNYIIFKFNKNKLVLLIKYNLDTIIFIKKIIKNNL